MVTWQERHEKAPEIGRMLDCHHFNRLLCLILPLCSLLGLLLWKPPWTWSTALAFIQCYLCLGTSHEQMRTAFTTTLADSNHFFLHFVLWIYIDTGTCTHNVFWTRRSIVQTVNHVFEIPFERYIDNIGRRPPALHITDLGSSFGITYGSPWVLPPGSDSWVQSWM